MELKAEWVSAIVAAGSAAIAILAAIFARRQAVAAKRQADAAHGDLEPNFYLEGSQENERAPWAFWLHANNFNRQPLVIRTLRVTPPAGLYAYDDATTHAVDFGPVKKQIEETGSADLPVNVTLEGVAPGGNGPTTYKHALYVIMPNPDVQKHEISVRVRVVWRYAREVAERQYSLDLKLTVGHR